MKPLNDIHSGAPKWGLIGALTTAFVASACCLGPLAIMALGAGGAWAGHLAGLEKTRSLFFAASVLFLGLAFHRVYRKGREGDCATGGMCSPNGNRRGRIAVWLVAAFVLAMLFFPYAVPFLVARG